MSPELWLAIIGQTIVIVGALIAAYMRQQNRLGRVEGKVDHLDSVETERGKDFDRLREQVNGISRSVARLEGAHSTCPWIAGQAVSPIEPPHQT